MNVKAITENSILTLKGDEIVLLLIQPTNVSVLSRDGLWARINALLNVMTGSTDFANVEFLCLNSRESFENNKRYIMDRISHEDNAQIRWLLEQDLRHLDEIQSRTASAREFMLVVRPKKSRREMYPYLTSLEKTIREHQFTVCHAGYDDIKRILAVYFASDVVSEGYEDFDGQRWLLRNGQSDYKAASVMEEEKVLQTFLDLIAPTAVKFDVDHYIMGNTWRCVWAIRKYPTTTEEQALLQRLGEKAGVSLHIYTRRVAPAEKDRTANTLILGSSGKGKSHLLKMLLLNTLEGGKKLICLDVEGEYEYMTRKAGGAYIDTTDGEFKINPLEPRMWNIGNDEEDLDAPPAFRASTLLSQHISFLRDFFRSYKSFTDAEIDTIEIMLGRLYSNWGINDETELHKLSSKDYPILSDLYAFMESEFQLLKTEKENDELYTAELLRTAMLGLNSMCVGADSKFFNGHTNVSTNRFITFGVRNLMEIGENVRNAMLFNILSYISHALIFGGNTAAVFEELHVFLSNIMAISYIRNAMKRVRKRNSMIVLASQNIEDFLLPGVAEMTKPLFSIPTHHFLFHPGTIDKKDYMNALQLEETEYQLILACQTGTCLYKCGSERYNLVVRTPEHKLMFYGKGGGR